MSIENHKWSDEDLRCVRFNAESIDLWASDGSGEITELFIDKQDSIAIAKHFNQDRESLVLKIEGLAKTVSNPNSEVFSVNDLLELTKEEI